MKILAFETSCDDTAVAIVEDGWRVLSSVRVSQLEHEAWGGVVPEIAARLHAEAWRPVLEKALAQAQLNITDIDYLACTQGPGLQTSLLTGTMAASLLSTLYQIPLLPVHHIYGHLCSVFLERESLVKNAGRQHESGLPKVRTQVLPEQPLFPALVLTASGGHTEFYLWENTTSWQKLGGSLDDAVGEAFDKVAKMLGLGYPGGPLVSACALKGDRKKYNLPVPNLGADSLDLSFSGVKAAVRRLIELEYPEWLQGAAHSAKKSQAEDAFINNVCASFEDVCARIFTKKLTTALDRYPMIKTFCFVGGVSANSHLNKVFSTLMQPYGINFIRPIKTEYSTDNAAMMASAAFWQLQKDPTLAQVQYVEAVPRLSL